MAGDGGLPTRQRPLDHVALERVLARAAELQAAEGDSSEAAITEEQLLEVAREAGLSVQHVRQALAEERSRAELPPERTRADRLFGPAHVYAMRTISLTPAAVFDLLDQWMQREQALQVKRRLADRMLWEPREGFVIEFKRALNVGGHGYHLSRAHEIAATVLPVDADRSFVRLEADLSNLRVQRVASGAAVAGGGVLGTATLLTLGFLAPVAALLAAAALAGGYLIARSHVPMLERAQIALEQMLDRLERGETPKPGLLSALDLMR